MFEHNDILQQLNQNISLQEKLHSIHQVIRSHFAQIDRIAIATYDARTDHLHTYVYSGDTEVLTQYHASLKEASSLQAILDQGKPRVINDLSIFAGSPDKHSQRILEKGYQSSYTLPMVANGVFFGFLFFNSCHKNAFPEEALHHLDIFGHLISLIIINEISAIRTLLGAIRSAREISHYRDNETGAHMDRMAHYAQLIAEELAPKYRLNDDFIEHILLFAPLHDIGKIGIPDHILLKPGKLTEDEFTLMKTHTEKGRHIIDEMMHSFDLSSFHHVDILRNIAEFHHEAINGSGYPKGLQGAEIPIEARITAVADVFDALTSRRPYKQAWSNEEAFAYLRRLAGAKFDRECVEALLKNTSRIAAIQKRFQDDLYG